MTTSDKQLPNINSEGDVIASDPKSLAKFWKWFINSCITDKYGRPIVAYHGTREQFVKFSAGEFGFHFGNISAADSFGEFGEVRQYYLSIRNPLIVYKDMMHWEPEDMVAILPYPKNDVNEFISNREEALQEVARLREVYEEDLAKDGDQIENRMATYAIGEPARKLYKKYGFDGVIYINEVEGRGIGEEPNWSYIAFDTKQVRRTIHPDLPLGTGPARAANGRRRNGDNERRALERKLKERPDDWHTYAQLLTEKRRAGLLTNDKNNYGCKTRP